MEAALQDPFEAAYHALDLANAESGPIPRYVWAAQDSEVITLPSVIVDESLLMDDWFFTEVVADGDDFAEPAPPRAVTRWLVMAGAASSLLVALLTLTV